MCKSRVGKTVHTHRISGSVPAQNTVRTPCTDGSGQPYAKGLSYNGMPLTNKRVVIQWHSTNKQKGCHTMACHWACFTCQTSPTAFGWVQSLKLGLSSLPAQKLVSVVCVRVLQLFFSLLLKKSLLFVYVCYSCYSLLLKIVVV